jgi:hypothetical protein
MSDAGVDGTVRESVPCPVTGYALFGLKQTGDMARVRGAGMQVGDDEAESIDGAMRVNNVTNGREWDAGVTKAASESP